MKRRLILFISALFFIVSFASVTAWQNCTPSSCAAGYSDNGQYCTGGTCYRNCTISTCTTDWVEVHSTTCGWSLGSEDENNCVTTGYTPTNTSQCYKFTYQGPPNNINNVHMSVTDAVSCDSSAIGGFWEGNPASSSPWFNGMSNYLGSTPGDPEYNYLLKMMRAHTDNDDTSSYRENAGAYGEIYCANNSVACTDLGGSAGCDSDCFGVSTVTNSHQGYYRIQGSTNDSTLYADLECGNGNVSANVLTPNTYKVYAATTVLSNSDVSCDRTNEAALVSGILVLPLNATAGQDLECNYTYTDIEGYAEQGSAFEWWKNGVNQNINSSYLDKGNLTIGDSWYCKVAPGDGLLLGTLTQSSNNLTILTTVQNVQMFVAGNSVWQYSNYFWGKNQVLNFTQQLNDAIGSCTADAEGYCTINLTLYSGDEGRLNLTKLGIYYQTAPQVATPQYSSILETPTDPTINYSFNAKYQFNITWTDDISVSTVTLEFDGTNYTSLSQNGNVYGKEFTNLALGTHTYRWYANDSSNNQNSTSTLTYTVNEAIHAFDLVNSTGGVVAWFGHLGHLVLKGTVQQSSSYQTASDDLFVINNNGQDVFIVAKNGTIYIDGTLNQNQASLTSLDSSNDFRIRNSSSLVSYVNNTGHLFLTQSIIENGIN